MTDPIKTWVVGASGLIGSAVARTSSLLPFTAKTIPWGTLEAPAALGNEFDQFVDWVGESDWAIVWAAGTGFFLSNPSTLELERELFESLCGRLVGNLPRGRGGFYVVSSAGGVYAGSSNPPFGPTTSPAPLNPYGRMKLAQEQLAVDVLSPVIPVSIGRFSNAYGPGQDLSKQQGLITQLCLSSLLRRPTTIFAPPQTLRDYIYVDDAASAVAVDLRRMVEVNKPEAVIRVVCSGRAVTIDELIGIVEGVSGRTVPLTHQLGDGPFFLDLRLEGSGQEVTSLEAGVALVLDDLARKLADGQLVEPAPGAEQ